MYFFFSAIMPCSNEIATQFSGFFSKRIELYFPVTKHVRVWSTTLFIFSEHIINNPLAIRQTKVYLVERNVQLFRHHLREHKVIFPMTLALKKSCRIIPVSHKQTGYVIS